MIEGGGEQGTIVVRRLHRLVRHGYVPLLGYDVAGGGDRDIQLHRRGTRLTLRGDGAVCFASPDPAARAGGPPTLIAGPDADGFDALFPPDTPNKRNLVRRLYEMGLGS